MGNDDLQLDVTDRSLGIVLAAGQAAAAAGSPEEAIHAIASAIFDTLGDRTAHLRDEAMAPGQRQYFVAGCFFVTPDRRHQMLVGSIGFPAEQRRLLIPIDGGNPGQVIASGRPLLLADTNVHPEFRQYLKTSRMGSAVYAPLIWKGDVLGLIIMAAQARWTFGLPDLAVLSATAPAAAAAWIAHGGQGWLQHEYASISDTKIN